MSDYHDFISAKRRMPEDTGFRVRISSLNQNAHDWQKNVVQWAVERGRAALFLDTGLGKTRCQLSWAEQVAKKERGAVLLHCPVGVRHQTAAEAERIGLSTPVEILDDCDGLKKGPRIVVANYEKLHRFDTQRFVGCVLDESSILKSYTGSTKRSLCERWSHTKYRLACTATPSPNDHMELGNHAEFLGIMPSNEMLSRWFYNDTMKAGGYKILPHGEDSFWQWISSWAVACSRPSDIGGDDTGYVLPELRKHTHIVHVSDNTPDKGHLFRIEELSATNVHKEKRRSTPDRAAKVAEIVGRHADETWIVWCDTNYEADELLRLMPQAVDIRGAESESAKERKLREFSNGTIRVLITKPTVAGFGMNWQHCSHMAFIGLSYSFEQYYRAVRRCWRFGQTRPVDVHVVMAEGEALIEQANLRKATQHESMQVSMSIAMRAHQALSQRKALSVDLYEPKKKAEVPTWLCPKT